MNSSDWNRLNLVWVVVGGSLLLSLYTFLVPEPYNDDAYLYVRTAELFQEGGFSAALAHYSWPAYSVLIGSVAAAGLDLFSAAFLINALLFALLSYALFEILRSADSSRETQWVAVLCILFYPELNEYRYLLVRDIGFWAFSFFGLLSLLRYGSCTSDGKGLHPDVHLVLFCLSMLCAALFRLEAMGYLLLTPLGMIVLSKRANNSPASQVNYPRVFAAAILSLGLAALLLMLSGFSLISLVSEFLSSYQPFVESVMADDPIAQDNLAQAVFGEYAAGYSDDVLYLFIGAGLTAVLVASVVKGVGLLLLSTLVYGLCKQRQAMPFRQLQPVWMMALVNLAIVWFFLVITRYLPSRYAMVACISLVLFVPPVVGALLRQINPRRNSTPRTVLLLMLVYLVIDSYYSLGKSEDFVNESIAWLNDPSRNERRLVTNNREIAFASGRVVDYDRPTRFIEESQLLDSPPGAYLAIETHPRLEEMLQRLTRNQQIRLEQEFIGEAGSIVVYRRLPN